VLLVHGFRGTAVDWSPLAERLSETRDVWAPDLITDHPGMSPVHDLLERVRVAAGGTPVDVVASSMGGYVATSWAAAAPAEVHSLTLLAPALVDLQPLWRVPGFTRLIALQAALDADERKWRAELATLTSATALAHDTPHHLDIPEEWRQAMLDHSRAASTDETAAGRIHARQEILRALMRTLRQSQGVATLVARVQTPVLWLHATDDPLVPFGPSQDVARKLKECTFIPLEGVGHIPHLECPDLVASRFTMLTTA
jgi:pimeloyl-ACP methyl ester carboxylesterase